MSPALSAIVITPDGYATIARLLGHLAAQTRASAIEIVLCCASRATIPDSCPEWSAFHSLRIIEIGPVGIIAEAKALGVRAASAPIVAFTEEHAFPEPRWAASLIERHREAHAVVGPEMVNPNPESPMSWANFVVEYGPWISPAQPGPRPHVPGNNSSYKRERLLAYGDRLAAALDAETILHWELAAQGETLYLEPQAQTRHLNITRLDAFRRVHREYGRMFAAQRSRQWSLVRRLVYGCGSPLIPLVRLARVWPDIQRGADLPRGDARFWFYVALALGDAAWGEMQGYVAGPGQSREAIFELEFHRSRYLNDADTASLDSLA